MTASGTSNNKQEDWTNKLVGKKITDDGASDEMVCISTVNRSGMVWYDIMLSTVQSFAKKDLPKTSRVVEHGSMITQDHNPDRLVF